MKTSVKVVLFLIVTGGTFYVLQSRSATPWGRSGTYEIAETRKPEPIRAEDIRRYQAVLNTPPAEKLFHEIDVPDTVFRIAKPGMKIECAYRAVPMFKLESVDYRFRLGQIDENWGEGTYMLWAAIGAASLGAGFGLVILVSILARLLGFKRELE